MVALRLDLHVHSRHSPDSRLSLEAIAARISSVGLDGFALTDHNTVAGHAEIPLVRTKFPNLVVVPGVEVSTVEGHLLVYGVTEAPVPNRPVRDTIEWVRAHGGTAVLAHPFRFSHGVGRAVADDARVPAIETVNGHNSAGANARAAAVAQRRGLGSTGGSDGHDVDDLGRAFTEFEGGLANAAAILASLGAGRSTAAGRSLTVAGRLRYEWHTAVLRLRRGFRPI
jgi:predicted metal-dependent phosphoesterase TrpH